MSLIGTYTSINKKIFIKLLTKLLNLLHVHSEYIVGNYSLFLDKIKVGQMKRNNALIEPFTVHYYGAITYIDHKKIC